MIQCPTCRGSKKGGAGFVSGAGGCRVETLPCSTCRGNGSVPDDYLKRRAAGMKLRNEREGAGLSLGALARLAGTDIGPAHVSGAERGYESLEEVQRLVQLVYENKKKS